MGNSLCIALHVILGYSSDGSSDVWMGWYILTAYLTCFSLTVFNSDFTTTTTTVVFFFLSLSIFVSSHSCFVSFLVTSADRWGLPGFGGLEGGPGRKYVAYIFICSQSAVGSANRKKMFHWGPNPLLGGPACYSIPESRFGSCRSFLFFARGYQIKDELHGIRSTPRILKLL
jgi:hypothetical protein